MNPRESELSRSIIQLDISVMEQLRNQTVTKVKDFQPNVFLFNNAAYYFSLISTFGSDQTNCEKVLLGDIGIMDGYHHPHLVI